jgi:hypothetical protein
MTVRDPEPIEIIKLSRNEDVKYVLLKSVSKLENLKFNPNNLGGTFKISLNGFTEEENKKKIGKKNISPTK